MILYSQITSEAKIGYALIDGFEVSDSSILKFSYTTNLQYLTYASISQYNQDCYISFASYPPFVLRTIKVDCFRWSFKAAYQNSVNAFSRGTSQKYPTFLIVLCLVAKCNSCFLLVSGVQQKTVCANKECVGHEVQLLHGVLQRLPALHLQTKQLAL